MVENIDISYPNIGERKINNFDLSVLKPTKIMSYVFLGLFLSSMFIGLIMNGINLDFTGDDSDAIMTIGYPYPMLVITTKASDSSPFNVKNIVLDLLIVLTISYAINLIFNLIIPKDSQEKEVGGTIKEVKIKKSLAEKTAETVVSTISGIKKGNVEQLKTPQLPSKNNIN